MKCAFFLLLFLLLGCSSEEARLSSISGIGNGGSGNSVSFTVSNLGVSPLVLSLNDESQFLVTSDGTYTFGQKVKPGSEFEVLIGGDPADRNCVVIDPVKVSNGPMHVSVKCAPHDHHYYSGNISGLSTSVLAVRISTSNGSQIETIVPEGATKWTSDLPTTGTPIGIVIVSQPAGLICNFTNSSISTANVHTGVFDNYHIDCRLDNLSTYTLQVQVSGLSGSLDIVTNNNFHTISSTSSYSLGTFRQNDRHILEIVTAPTNQRCFFNQTKNHLYSETISSAFDHTVQITCTTRPPCGNGGVELPSVNGVLNDLECINDKFVYAGKFTTFGKQMGILRVQSTATAPSPDFKAWDRIYGIVHDITADGRSGMYVGGEFAKAGDLHRRNLVHMLSNLTVNESFDIETNGTVHKIISVDNKVYIFGDFTQVIQSGTVYPRDGFAKIDHSSLRPVITNLTLPKGIKVKPNTGMSGAVFGSLLYVHGGFVVNGVSKNISARINRHTGQMTHINSPAAELSRSLYWQEPATGKIWLLNSQVGIVDPMTFAAHPSDSGHNYVPLNHEYTIDPFNNHLYSSDGTKVVQTQLNSIHNATGAFPVNWGKNTSGVASEIKNVGQGFITSTNICFFQKSGTPEINVGTSEKRKGIACFGTSSGVLQPFNPGNVVEATKANVNGNNIYLNPTHWVHQRTNALAMVNASGTFYSYSSTMLEGDEVFSLAKEGSNLFVGGNFPLVFGCPDCKHIAKFAMPLTTLDLDLNWYFSTPFSAPVKKLSQQGGVLVGISEDPTRSIFGLITSSAPDTIKQEALPRVPLDIHNIGDSMIIRQTDRVTFNERTLLGSAPLTTIFGNSAITSTTSRLVTAFTSGILFMHDLDGAVDYESYVSDFNPSTLELTTVGDYPCFYNGGSAVYCTDQGGVIKLSKSIPDEDFTNFRTINNAAVLLKGRSAPVMLVPDP